MHCLLDRGFPLELNHFRELTVMFRCSSTFQCTRCRQTTIPSHIWWLNSVVTEIKNVISSFDYMNCIYTKREGIVVVHELALLVFEYSDVKHGSRRDIYASNRS